MGRARYDQNIHPSLIAVSSADGSTPVELWADPTTHLLQTSASASLAGSAVPASGLTTAVAVQIVDGSGNQITSFGGGTQYTNGGVPPANPIGPTLLFNNAGAWATVGSAAPLPVNATLTAETTKVIGVTRTSDGAGNLLTSNSTATAGKFGLDSNILSILGTAPTTAGKLDVKGADGDVFVRQATATNLKAQVVAGDATGAAVPANAFYNGVNAQTALPTAATAGNLTGMMSDKFGRQVILNNAIRDIMGTQTTTITASTTETTIVTAAASIFNDLLSIFISNTSGTAVRVDIRDTTAGSVIFQLYVPAGDMRGLSLTTPWPQTTVNTNWTATSSASVTDLRVSALFIKNK